MSFPPAAPTEGTAAKPPSLAVDIAETILAIAVQRAAIASLWDSTAMSRPLNALPRSAAPLVSKVALLHLPHIDLDTATRLNDVSLLRFMLAWSKQPSGRPVNYKWGIYLAMSHGHLAAFEWWVDESNLSSRWEGGLDAACGYGNLHILEAWAARGFPYLEVIAAPICLIQRAATNGQVRILDWLWEHLPDAPLDFSEAAKDHSTWSWAASAGSVDVLDWWYEKRQSGVITVPSFAMASIRAMAMFADRKLACLEWCQAHPQVILHQPQLKKKAAGEHFWWEAMKDHRCDWIDALELLPPKPAQRWRASSAACEHGNVYALKWLENKGYLIGSRQQLLAIAIVYREKKGDSIPSEVLAWIDEHVDDAIPEYSKQDGKMLVKGAVERAIKDGCVLALDLLCRYGIQLPSADAMGNCFRQASANVTGNSFRQACKSSRVKVLDWLVSHYQPTPDQLHEVATSFRDWGMYGNFKLCPEVFEWWRTQLQPNNMELPRGFIVVLGAIRSVVELNWWLDLPNNVVNGQIFDFRFAPNCHMDEMTMMPSCEDAGAVLKVWIAHDLPFDIGMCIRWAFIGGEVQFLEWLVAERRVSARDLMAQYQDMVETGYSLHQHSALWCWAKCPRPVPDPTRKHGWSGFDSPIHAHLVQTLLPGIHVSLPDVERASKEDNVPMLVYLKSLGRLLVDKDCPADKLDSILVAASGDKYNLQVASVSVLEWWKKHSGVALTDCPKVIARGERRISDIARKWWQASGLCDTVAPFVHDNAAQDDESDGSRDEDELYESEDEDESDGSGDEDEQDWSEYEDEDESDEDNEEDGL